MNSSHAIIAALGFARTLFGLVNLRCNCIKLKMQYEIVMFSQRLGPAVMCLLQVDSCTQPVNMEHIQQVSILIHHKMSSSLMSFTKAKLENYYRLLFRNGSRNKLIFSGITDCTFEECFSNVCSTLNHGNEVCLGFTGGRLAPKFVNYSLCTSQWSR